MTKIGLEIHCQLTNLQVNCSVHAKQIIVNLNPMKNICPVCAGMPGSLLD